MSNLLQTSDIKHTKNLNVPMTAGLHINILGVSNPYNPLLSMLYVSRLYSVYLGAWDMRAYRIVGNFGKIFDLVTFSKVANYVHL